MCLLPLLLIVPNVALDITEIQYSALDRVVNVLLPLGVYLLLCVSSSKIGRTAVLFIPVMVLCAFQLVLLFLYGESIIAIDMFLNVATSNPGEAGELLSNLSTAILVVVVLYLPPIVLGIRLWRKNRRLTSSARRVGAIIGAALVLGGLICWGFMAKTYRADRKLFPVNVISNMFVAVERTDLSINYDKTSAPFDFHAQISDTASAPEIVVLVVGETSRADNWQLNGYERSTNPRLSKRHGLVNFTRVLSESNTTHKSVPLLLSHLSAAEFGDSIYDVKGVMAAFGEAGYATSWLSNQPRNHSLIDYFGSQADSVLFLNDDGKHHYDMELLPHLAKAVNHKDKKRIMVALHSYGSHFNYRERYPSEYSVFKPDAASSASAENRDELLNAYDNSVLYTDALLDSVISIVSATGRPAAMLYLADHGEDIFDDSRERFLHASPTPTYWQIHVPMVVWLSRGYRAQNPDALKHLVANSGRNISSSRSAFHTLLSLGKVKSGVYNPDASVVEATYSEPTRIYLNDYNEATSLRQAGLRDNDFDQLAKRSVKY